MILTKNKKSNFEALKAEIYGLISNSKTDKELFSKLEDILNFYKESELTK